MIFLLILSSLSFAEEDFFATVVMLKGRAQALMPGQTKAYDIKPDQRLDKGVVLATAEKSFVRLILRDNSTINLGPASKVELSSTPKDDPSLLNLISGQLRAKVNKEVIKEEKSPRDKLRIRTRTAAMGVRGTDFLVAFNEQNQNTSLLTFEGNVALAKLDPTGGETPRQALEGSKVVFVSEGNISIVTEQLSAPAEPVKLSPSQFEALKTNDSLIAPSDAQSNTKSGDKEKVYLPPIPPGVDPSDFAGDPVDEDVSVELGKEEPKVGLEVLRPGVLFDPVNSVAISPPPGSVYDANTGVFVFDQKIAKVDFDGGINFADGLILTTQGLALDADYQPPQGLNTDILEAIIASINFADPEMPADGFSASWSITAQALAQTYLEGTEPSSFDLSNLAIPPPPPEGFDPDSDDSPAPPPPVPEKDHLPPPPPPCTQCLDDNIDDHRPPNSEVKFNIIVQ